MSYIKWWMEQIRDLVIEGKTDDEIIKATECNPSDIEIIRKMVEVENESVRTSGESSNT